MFKFFAPHPASGAGQGAWRKSRPERGTVVNDLSSRFRQYSTHPTCRIIVDSCSDITRALAEELGVDLIQFPFVMEDGRVQTETNHAGGILGGITSGMPIVLRTAMKPTPSIAQPQRTVSLSAGENAELVIHGRHDPCIAHRAVPVVEAVTAAVLLDLLLEGHHGTF